MICVVFVIFGCGAAKIGKKQYCKHDRLKTRQVITTQANSYTFQFYHQFKWYTFVKKSDTKTHKQQNKRYSMAAQ